MHRNRLPLLALALAALCACEKPGPRERPLRILSWNTFNLPTIAGEQGQINMDEKERGKLVARLLKRSPYEVIALNEVFDETVRDALIEEAESGSDAFRFVVEDLDGGGLEDSGLVLFSRLDPIRFTAPEPVLGQHGGFALGAGFAEPFAGTHDYWDTRSCAAMDVWWKGQPNDGEVDSWISGSGGNCLVAFHRYRACTDVTPDDSPFGAECEAGKGVAYVRLRQSSGQPLDVYWSHTQATLRSPEYELPLPDFLTERRNQIEELIAMVEHWSPRGQTDVAILGDLNIDGNRAPLGKDEYLKLIGGSASRLGSLGFRDLWPESAPKNDFGLTYAHRNDHVTPKVPEERLDYVLWRDRKGGDMCGQHPFVERHFDWLKPGGATVDLSDHFGAGVELRRRNRAVPGGNEPCSPFLARTVDSLLPSAEMKGTLFMRGACQWLRFEPGTWTVTSFTSDPLSLTAWDAIDISEPVKFFRGDPELHSVEKQDEVQIASDKPFYLKICWADPGRTGDFRIKVAPNTGADPQHPVVLTLNRFTDAAFGSQFGANPATLLWTLVSLPETFSRDPHAVGAAFSSSPSATVRVGTAPVGSASPPITWFSGFSSSWAPQAAGSFGGSAATELFLVIERQAPADPSAAVPFRFGASTDHHEVRLGALECIEQEDATGDDHVRMTYTADGRTLKIVDLGDFDEGQDVNLSTHTKLGLNWVKGPVTITIFDQDGSDLDNDVTSGNALDNLGTITIADFAGPVPFAQEIDEKTGAFTQDGANYRLEHRKRR